MKMERKIFILLICFCAISIKLFAQNASATATQTVQLNLSPVIDLKFTNTNTSTGSVVDMAFNNINDYSNGVVSGTQELSIRSNNTFKISVQTDAATFSYSGNQPPSSSLLVANALSMTVTSNATGGTVASAFDNSYNHLSTNSQDLILNGQYGGDQKMAIAYKANPGMDYPAGIYTVGVIYTATQP